MASTDEYRPETNRREAAILPIRAAVAPGAVRDLSRSSHRQGFVRGADLGDGLNQGLTIDRCDVLMQNNREGYQQNLSQQAFYRDGSAKSNNTSKEKYNEELRPVTPVNPQIIGSPAQNSDNISIFA